MIAASVLQAGLIGYLGAAAAYLVLVLLAAYWWNNTLTSLMIAVASGATMLWAVATAYSLGTGASIGWVADIFEVARSCGWTTLLLSMLYWLSPARRSAGAAAIFAFGAVVAALIVVSSNAPAIGLTDSLRVAVVAGHLTLAVLGIVMVENLFRNSPPSRIWRIKHLCLGLGALFTYDFALYSNALLFHRLSVDLFLAHGVVNFLAMPLLAIYAARGRAEGPELAVSRRAALHSATLVGAGFYLIVMAIIGYYIQHFGTAWSSFLQAVLLFGAALLFLMSILSRSFRTYLHVFLEKHLFKYKYDYRTEWLRFIATISQSGRGDDLRGRVVEAMCDIMNSPEGALWLRQDPDTYRRVTSWNSSRWSLQEAEATIASNSPLALFLERTQWIVDADEFARDPMRYPDLVELPAWMRDLNRLWLIVPLMRHEQLFGVVLIGRARAPRALTWEDFDLLKTVGRQAASYLVEEETSRALTEARQFEEFNKRFAFVAHDIKNLASQLSLIVSNAARHRGNAAFQQDAAETLQQSVDKLNRMLRQLNARPSRHKINDAVALVPLLRNILADHERLQPAISLDLRTADATVAADEDRLKAVIGHLVQNAVDAAGDEGQVRIRLMHRDKMAVIEIEDDGPGMPAEFVRDQLFRPFATTKESGYGIGVYESRDYATSLGGRIDVITEPGKGTVMRMSVPLVEGSE